MVDAISYEKLLEDLHRTGRDDITFGILIGNPNCEFVKNIIINRISEYHHSSNTGIDFYFPGYGAYWHDTVPDSENVCNINGVQWSFSSQKFIDFIEKLEECSKWNYSGETELIILNYKNGELDFSEVLVFWLDRMVKENIIYSPSNFFRKIFKIFKENTPITKTSDRLAFEQIGNIIIDTIKRSLPGKMGKIFDESKYFCTRDLKKN